MTEGKKVEEVEVETIEKKAGDNMKCASNIIPKVNMTASTITR